MIKVNEIKMATIQMVGNKTRGEGLSGALTLADVSGFLEAVNREVVYDG